MRINPNTGLSRKYYLHAYRGKANHAGSKAVNDCEEIMRKLGYKELSYGLAESNNKVIAKIQKMFSELKLFEIPYGSLLVVEHPIYIKRNYLLVLKKIKKIKKIKLAFIIHDLESIRHLLPDSDVYSKRDYQMYEIADFIIAHNPAMKNYLVDKCNVEKERIIELGVFDYLTEKNVQYNRKMCKNIAIAGNLAIEKSEYIYSLINKKFSSISLNLYGVNFDEKLCTEKNYSYKGSFDANDLPNQLEGAYGLVWDGNSLDSCLGNTGNYLKYNNPHKVSLYIAAKMPIVIWKEAALAKFVLDNKIGIAVDSLNDLDRTLDEIDDVEYQSFIEHLDIIAPKITSGNYLKDALFHIESHE